MAEDSLSEMRKKYFLEILEINKRSDIRMKKLKDAEEEKTALKNKVSLLRKEDSELRKKLESQNERISKLKLEEYSLTEERKFLKEMEDQISHKKRNKEDELWKMRQSVYSSVAQHCDGIMEVFKSYSLKNMKEFIEAKLENRECFNKDSNPFAKAVAENSERHGTGRKKLLIAEISRLRTSIEKLKEQEDKVFQAQARKAQLKYEPINGSEHIRLQNELKDLRSDIHEITTRISTLERANNGTPTTMNTDDQQNSHQASNYDDSHYGDNLPSPYRSYSRDYVGSSTTLNQFHENFDQNNLNANLSSQENLHETFSHKNVVENPTTQEFHRMNSQSTTFKESNRTQAFVYKPPKYFKQSQPK